MRDEVPTTATRPPQPMRITEPSAMRSIPIMTKYEFTSLIGLRTTHLAKGAPPFVHVPPGLKVRSNMELRDIAIRELLEGKLPYVIKRPFPSGYAEFVRVSDLDLTAVRCLMRMG